MRNHIFIAAVFTTAFLGAAPRPSTQVTVRVITVGHLSGVEEVLAQHTARLLFAKIGIDVEYRDTEDAILLRIWAEAPREIDRYALGVATLTHTGSRRANVYVDRVRQFSGDSDARKIGILLGYVMAHELGHVLRDEPEHTETGIMKSCWSRGDADRMLHGIVGFTPADAARMLDVLAVPRPVRNRAGE